MSVSKWKSLAKEMVGYEKIKKKKKLIKSLIASLRFRVLFFTKLFLSFRILTFEEVWRMI